MQHGGPLVLRQQFALQIPLFLPHELQDPAVLVIREPIAMLVGTELHFEIVEPVAELLQGGRALRTLLARGGRAEHESPLPAVAEIENLVLQLLQLIVLEPHSPARLTVIDLELVPLRRLQVHTTPRTLHWEPPRFSIEADH